MVWAVLSDVSPVTEDLPLRTALLRRRYEKAASHMDEVEREASDSNLSRRMTTTELERAASPFFFRLLRPTVSDLLAIFEVVEI